MADIEFCVDDKALAKVSEITIAANFEETETRLRELLSPYSTMMVTADDIASAKTSLAKIRKVHKSIDDYRKSVKKAFTAPVTLFEAKVKVLTGICDEAETNLSGQINTFVERQKREKIDGLEQFFNECSEDVKGYITFAQIQNPRWENTTFAVEDAQEEIRAAVAGCIDGINAIRDLQSPFEATLLSDFKQHHNLAACMKKHKELTEIQRKEDERREAERKAKEAAEMVKVEEPKPTIKKAVVPTPAEEAAPNQTSKTEALYDLSFRVRATRKQLVQLKQAFEAIGLTYERID